MSNKNVFNTYQKVRSKLEEYSKNNIEYVQIDEFGINPVICKETVKSNTVIDAINVFSSFETEKIKQLVKIKKQV